MPSREEEVKAWEAVTARRQARYRKSWAISDGAHRVYDNVRRYIDQHNRPPDDRAEARREDRVKHHLLMKANDEIIRAHEYHKNVEAMNRADDQIQATKSKYPESAPLIDKLLRAVGFDVTETKRR